MTRGFTLVEVMVALVILEVGLLGVTGLALLANRTMSRVEVRERMAIEVELVADSLAQEGGGAAAGRREVPWGVVEWRAAGSGGLVFDVQPAQGAGYTVEGLP